MNKELNRAFILKINERCPLASQMKGSLRNLQQAGLHVEAFIQSVFCTWIPGAKLLLLFFNITPSYIELWGYISQRCIDIFPLWFPNLQKMKQCSFKED